MIAKGIEARRGETLQAARRVAREPGAEGIRPAFAVVFTLMEAM